MHAPQKRAHCVLHHPTSGMDPGSEKKRSPAAVFRSYPNSVRADFEFIMFGACCSIDGICGSYSWVTVVEPGDVLADKYRVERILGRGGMGYVVEAVHVHLNEPVAIKLMMPELCEQEEPVTRFLREARASVRIRSEHVARVLDVGTLEDGAPYMVMEYLDGWDLSEELDQRQYLPIGDAVDYILQSCEAIAVAHSIGIVHRDLKPANLFLTRRADDTPLIKVLDFGISKAIVTEQGQLAPSLTATQALMGSPNYMSPEQVRRPKTVDTRTDIWALGVILHEFLTGHQPFVADTAMSVLAAVVSDPPPNARELRPDIPEGLNAVILKCLEKNPKDRYQHVAELARALAPYAPDYAVPSVSRIAGILKTSGRTIGGSERVVSPSDDTLAATPVSGGPGRDQVPFLTLEDKEAPRTIVETTTEWGDNVSRSGKRSPLPLLLAGVLASALAVAGIVAFTRSYPPERTKTEREAAASPARVVAPLISPPVAISRKAIEEPATSAASGGSVHGTAVDTTSAVRASASREPQQVTPAARKGRKPASRQAPRPADTSRVESVPEEREAPLQTPKPAPEESSAPSPRSTAPDPKPASSKPRFDPLEGRF